MTKQVAPQTALITGANSGIGLALTQRLLQEEWNVVALIRSPFPTNDSEIGRAQAEQRLRTYSADMRDFRSLQGALQQIKAREQHIDVLFNNAAAAAGSIQYSPQGRELHFEVNTVVPYIILMELKPLLMQGRNKTAVNTSSNALLSVKQFDLETLQRPTKYVPIFGPYATSKLGLSLWTQELAPLLASEGIELRSMNPGGNKTKMTAGTAMPRWLLLVRHLFFAHPRVGAARLYDVAFGAWRGTIGIFVNNNKATQLPFTNQGRAVLETVDGIYQHEFLNVGQVID